MDSTSSNITPEAIKLAEDNRIELMTFPTHTTRILEALDVSVFESFLMSHSRSVVNDHLQHNIGATISRVEFGKLVKKAYLSSFTQSNILSFFRATGLFPVDIDETNLSYHYSLKRKMMFLLLEMTKMNVLAAPILFLLFQQHLFGIQARKKQKIKKVRVLAHLESTQSDCMMSAYGIDTKSNRQLVPSESINENQCPVCAENYYLRLTKNGQSATSVLGGAMSDVSKRPIG